MQATSNSIAKKVNFSAIFSDFKQLTKVGLSLSVVFSSLAGYLLAVEYWRSVDISWLEPPMLSIKS
jgi:protoheme IX farnesyltransferase